jgi:uncharacterized protein YjbI with pentapeptide repeats
VSRDAAYILQVGVSLVAVPLALTLVKYTCRFLISFFELPVIIRKSLNVYKTFTRLGQDFIASLKHGSEKLPIIRKVGLVESNKPNKSHSHSYCKRFSSIRVSLHSYPQNIGASMKLNILATIMFLIPIGLAAPSQAANPHHIQRLLETKQCIGCDLSGANLSGADLREANLGSADLYGANLQGADLQGANLTDAQLDNANLDGANLRDVTLQWTNLEGANLQRTDLSSVNLEWAHLVSTDLREANLKQAKLNTFDLESVNLCGATMPDGSLFYEGCP